MPRYWVIAPYHADQPKVWDRIWRHDLKHSIISIGWYQLGDVSLLTEEQLKERIDRTFPDDPPGVRMLYRRMIRDFYHSIKVGDVIIARRGRKRIAAASNGSSKPKLPMSEGLNYQSPLNSITAAVGSFHMQFSHDDPVPGNLAQGVIKQSRTGQD